MPHRLVNFYFALLLRVPAVESAPASRPDGLVARVKYHLFDPNGLTETIRWGGTALLVSIVFVETGLLVGFFLPGDSLLVTAGFLAADPVNGLSLGVLVVLLSVAAVVGDAVGFWIGSKAGPALFKRDDSLLFKKKHLQRAHAFYEKYGGKTIIIARFVPIIRTFAPTVAGAARMDYRRFAFFNVIGGVSWVASMLVAGWLVRRSLEKILGQDQVMRYLHLLIAVVIVLSILPGVFEFWRERRRAQQGA